MKASLKKSCPHCMDESFARQVERLKQSWFLEHHLVVLGERILQKVKMAARGVNQFKSKDVSPFVSILYLHGVSHKLKKGGH